MQYATESCNLLQSHTICYRVMQSATVRKSATGWCTGVVLQFWWNTFQKDFVRFLCPIFLSTVSNCMIKATMLLLMFVCTWRFIPTKSDQKLVIVIKHLDSEQRQEFPDCTDSLIIIRRKKWIKISELVKKTGNKF